MSSTYYVGPFGLPGSHPYQLPPPRASVPLQFGSDPFLRYRNRGENVDEREGSSSYSKGHSHRQANKQLPSVSQLLTPTAHSSRSPSPYNSLFGIYFSPSDAGEIPEQSTRRHDSGTIPFEAQPGLRDHSKTPSDLRISSQSRTLPPIAQISSNNLHDTTVYPALHPNQPNRPYTPSLLQRRGSTPNDREFAGISSPETPVLGPLGAGKSVKPHVRPHVVDERYIEGEGLCYIYADGSHCPKIIDGVPVNANWGITKAGKPRKRLAQACLTCREKKIKCQPNLPKCDQCQKSGRECRFESAPRGHRAAFRASQFASRYDSSPSAYSNNAGTSNSLYSVARASESCTSLPGTDSQSPLSDGSLLTPSAVDSNHASAPDSDQQHAAKLARASSGHGDISSGSVDAPGTASTDYAEILMELKDLDTHDPLAIDWKTDPYSADPELTAHLLETYFTFVNDRLYYMFPRRPFLLWLKSCQTKSLDDHMLLYSMMALGSVFSGRSDKMSALKRYSRIARYAVEHGPHSLSLQLAQSSILMSLWYYAIGALVKSWDAAGAAVRTVCGLRYNVEIGGVIVDQSQPCEYGLHPQALIECRRRTYWTAFLIDRFSCFYSPSTTFISSQTAFLRLPCREEVYEAQQYATVPFFQTFLNQSSASREEGVSGLSAMALLIDIMLIWGDVSDHVLRLSMIPSKVYNKTFGEFYSAVVHRSDEWLSRLPDHLTFTAANLERSIRAKKVDPFISIQLLYHATLMKLNRFGRSQLIRPEMAKQCVHTARNHAAEILHAALALVRYASEYGVSQTVTEQIAPNETLLSPFLGYVIVSAIDVLSAGGLVVEIPECINLIQGGLTVLRELSCFWGSTTPLVTLIETRMDAMTETLREIDSEVKVAFFLDGPSLDSQVYNGVQAQDPTANEDLMYGGLRREQLFGAFGLDDVLFSEESIILIKSGS